MILHPKRVVLKNQITHLQNPLRLAHPEWQSTSTPTPAQTIHSDWPHNLHWGWLSPSLPGLSTVTDPTTSIEAGHPEWWSSPPPPCLDYPRPPLRVSPCWCHRSTDNKQFLERSRLASFSIAKSSNPYPKATGVVIMPLSCRLYASALLLFILSQLSPQKVVLTLFSSRSINLQRNLCMASFRSSYAIVGGWPHEARASTRCFLYYV